MRRTVGIAPKLEVDCLPLNARLTRRGCGIRQRWSLLNWMRPRARACWRCPQASEEIKQIVGFIREPAQTRLCPECGTRERAVDENLRVHPTCQECAQRLWRESVGWKDPEDEQAGQVPGQ